MYPALPERASHCGSLVPAPGMWLVAQQSLEVTCRRELAQRLTQHVGLTGQRRIVEGQIHYVGGSHLLVDAVGRGYRRLANEGAAAAFPTGQPHGFELG